MSKQLQKFKVFPGFHVVHLTWGLVFGLHPNPQSQASRPRNGRSCVYMESVEPMIRYMICPDSKSLS